MSSSSTSNNPIQNLTYDVFLICHDKEIAESFAAHLYSALTAVGFRVFMVDYESRTEDHANSSVVQAIKQSRSSIIVFSRNFVPSTWFLEEMETIMECRRTIEQLVLPVFYDVDPSDVRQQKGMFGKAFEDLAQNTLKNDEPMRYRAALTEACDTTGICMMNYRRKSEGINSILQTLTRLIESDSTIQQRTTRTYFNCRDMGDDRGCFEGKSILLDVAEVWKKHNGQVVLLQQLFSDIFGTRMINFNTVESAKMILQKRLCQKRILLVLDNVNKVEQLNALCSSRECFGNGSRIIITTRDRDLLRSLQVDHVYSMKVMDNIESLELFSWHAFNFRSPMESYVDLCSDFVEYCGGLPLALEVTGSYLWSRSVMQWISELQKFKSIPHESIMGILRTSFDDLDDKEKELFLNIASVFIGMDKDDVIQTLTYSRRFPDIGITVLEDKSLVTVDSKNRIGMHTLVRTMGREIIRQQSNDIAETKMYDVFLSFRGEDCRAKLISHLYSSLQNAGIYVFKDDDGIKRGDQISVSLLQAIGQSEISIVVLSRNFANSKWCMLELERIVEVGRTKSMVILPVFYEVDPSEVRHQTGEFGKAFESLISTISVDEYTKRNWKTALREVGGMAGIVVINSRNESQDINKVVATVTHLLDKNVLFVADHPVEIESRVQDVIHLLNSQHSKEPLLLGIWGMGGIGKTTIAKAVYNKIRDGFEAKSFLFNIRDAWKLDNDRVSLQQRLLSDIYKTTKLKIDTVESGKLVLKKRLCKKRIFLVVDDVNKLDQLKALCGNRNWFGEGSRIIITTRDADLLSKIEVDHVYKMKEMDDTESLELFNWHAFKQSVPKEGFNNLSKDVVKYSGGLPLALQVIGSFLSTTRTKVEWKSVLEKLKLIPNDEVLEKLRISFDGLSDGDIQDIFLDIVFFFIGMDLEDATKILEDCGHFPGIGISVLIQQSLVTVDRKNKIGMHDLLRDMGREIVRRKSEEGGKEPSRLWRYEDVHALSKDTSTLDVKGVTLKLSRMDSITYLETKVFEKMNKLRLLQLSGLQLDGDYKYLSKDIRWLCWHGFPLKCTPADIHQRSLVSIELKYSNLERVWRKSQLLEKLKMLNLSHSHNLRYTPDFSNLPNLEKLILKDCPSLSSVSPNIGHLKKLLLIDLKDCIGLRELPRSIYKLESVKTLILSGCTKIDKLEEDIEQMKSLTILAADNTAITRVPFAIVRLKEIGYISLCGHEGFPRRVFPFIIQSLLSPRNNISALVQTSAGTSCLSSNFEELHNLQHLWLICDSEAQLNQIVASILDSFYTQNCKGFSNIGTSASIQCRSQVCISSSKKSLTFTSLLIQMGMSCIVANILRENILQKMPPIGSGLLPSDNYPNWLTFSSNGSSVPFEVPQVDGRNLKTIMCLACFYSPDSRTNEGLKILLVINYTKNTIHVNKRHALLVSPDEGEWQRVISNIEPGNEIKVVVVFTNEFIVKKTAIYLIYDEPIEVKTKHYLEPDENVIGYSGHQNIFGRLFFALPSLVRAVLISPPFWFCSAGIMIWLSRRRSHY